ncbi:MAG: WxcM-like domain-containing protein [Bacilli bacterium]|nr:WxcM-like domain-containing protein [Bacilli bacterium]
MYNCSLIKFRKITSSSETGFGSLTPIEYPDNIPFEIKRVYYIYNVAKDLVRGHHSHKKLHQVLIAVKGSVKISVKHHYGQQEYILNDPSVGLYIGPNVWREMSDFSEDAVLLVLASDVYNADDYIRDYDEFILNNENLYGKKGN